MYKLVKSKAIIDGTGRQIDNGYILMKEGIIEEVGRLEGLEASMEKMEVIDLTEYYILPGLIDCHTHLSVIPAQGNQLAQMRLPAGRNILRSIPNIKRNLKSGVTTMRIMGEEHFMDIDIKNAIQENIIQGPRLLVSGKGLVASNGHGVALTVSDGEDEIRKHARENFAQGADLLKIFVTGGMSTANGATDFCGYTRKEISTAVEEAKRVGKYVAAHAHGGKGVDLCIEEGVRTIEHGALITDDQLDGIIKNEMWIIGTFSILFHETGIEKTDFQVKAIKEKVLRARDVVAENFAKFIKSGVNYSIGTDSMHGLISYELECLVNFGASNMEAIKVVTKNAAAACRIEKELGSLEKGKLGDFIAVPENPLEDIRSLRNVTHVFKEGVKVEHIC